MDKRIVLEWFKKVCATDAVKIFHNAMYDVCWIRAYGIPINGHIIDTMVMASLTDETDYGTRLIVFHLIILEK